MQEFALVTISLLSHADHIPSVHHATISYQVLLASLKMTGVDVSGLQLSCFMGSNYLRSDYLILANYILIIVFLASGPLFLLLVMVVSYLYLRRKKRILEADAKIEYYKQRMLRVLLAEVGFAYTFLFDDCVAAMFCVWSPTGEYVLFADQKIVCFQGICHCRDGAYQDY